jgi:uncharacterized protein YjiK
VAESFPLDYRLGGKSHEIVKAEGVTLDVNNNRLYLVSDKEARLYLFEIGESNNNNCNKVSKTRIMVRTAVNGRC